MIENNYHNYYYMVVANESIAFKDRHNENLDKPSVYVGNSDENAVSHFLNFIEEIRAEDDFLPEKWHVVKYKNKDGILHWESAEPLLDYIQRLK